MALTNEQRKFIDDVAKYVVKYADSYGIKVHSPIIAQAILESGWGKSTLSAKYHNYFGMKCGTKWTGKSVNMKTSEEYEVGVHTVISDNFRVYDSMEEGIKGYFEFIQLSRYSNLKSVTDPYKYLQLIKEDGYATSSTYVESVYKCITKYNLTDYDPENIVNQIRERAIQWMENLAADDSHGYDQKYRWGENGDYDCSSAVISAWENAGVHVKASGINDNWTGTIKRNFLATGEFEDVTLKVNFATGEGLQRADILLNEQKHVAMYCGNGKEVEASINELGTAKGGKPGDQTGKEILVRNYRNYPWKVCLRYKGKFNNKSEKKPVNSCIANGQIHLNNFTGLCVSVNGKINDETKKALRWALQMAYNIDFQAGLTIDGEIGNNSKNVMKKYPIKLGFYGVIITILEVALMLHGYDVELKNPDKFSEKLLDIVKQYQKQNNLTVDGEVGVNTWTSLLFL